MEFQGTIRAASGVMLGRVDAIEAALACLFVDLAFAWTRSGAEKLMEMDGKGIAVPDVVRKVLAAQRSSRCGNWSDGMVNVSLNLGSEQDVECIWVTISGDDCSGNRILAMLREIPGWSIVSPEALETVHVRFDDPIRNHGRAVLYVDQRDTASDS